MTWAQAITLAIAVLGAVLGIINTWAKISERRVRLRVRPMSTVGGPPGAGFSIEVTNLSAFALTISEVGFLKGRATSSSPARMLIAYPLILDGGQWPRKLEPRDQVSLYLDPQHIPHGSIGKAYAKTLCGELAVGDSPALKQLRQGGTE